MKEFLKSLTDEQLRLIRDGLIEYLDEEKPIKKPSVRKSKFQERLEEAMRLNQEAS